MARFVDLRQGLSDVPVQGTPEFTFKDQKVRVVMIEGAPWFAAPDVVRCFGIDAKSGTFNSLRPLAGDEKRVLRKGDATVAFPFHGTGSACAIVSESGLYKLVMRSDKPEAKAKRAGRFRAATTSTLTIARCVRQ